MIGMSENVDYWNHLGWVDPFSSAVFTSRQSEYAVRMFRDIGVYTPQMVIDGKAQEIGSDAPSVYEDIIQAAKVPKATVNIIASGPTPHGDLKIKIDIVVPTEVAIPELCDVVIAITEDNMATHVRSGENGGKYLTYSGLVRKLLTAGSLKVSDREWSGATSVVMASDWKPSDLKVIGFLQGQEGRRVLGVGWSKLVSQATVP